MNSTLSTSQEDSTATKHIIATKGQRLSMQHQCLYLNSPAYTCSFGIEYKLNKLQIINATFSPILFFNKSQI